MVIVADLGYEAVSGSNKTRCLFNMSSCLLIVSSCLPVALSCLFRGYPKISTGPWTGLWILGKKITLESPSSRHLLKFCRKTTKVSSWRQMFEKLRRVKFLAITLSLKDIELGLKIPMESFPWLIYNRLLVENMLREVKRPHSFKYGTRFSAVYEKGHWSI